MWLGFRHVHLYFFGIYALILCLSFGVILLMWSVMFLLVLCKYSKFRIESISYFSIWFDLKWAQLFKIFEYLPSPISYLFNTMMPIFHLSNHAWQLTKSVPNNRALAGPWKSLNFFSRFLRPGKSLKTDMVLESPWICVWRSLKVLEFDFLKCRDRTSWYWKRCSRWLLSDLKCA